MIQPINVTTHFGPAFPTFIEGGSMMESQTAKSKFSWSWCVSNICFRSTQDCQCDSVEKARDYVDYWLRLSPWNMICSIRKLNLAFLTLQKILNEILCHGGNKCKIPHMWKEALQRQRLLPKSLEVRSKQAIDFFVWMNGGYYFCKHID